MRQIARLAPNFRVIKCSWKAQEAVNAMCGFSEWCFSVSVPTSAVQGSTDGDDDKGISQGLLILIISAAIGGLVLLVVLSVFIFTRFYRSVEILRRLCWYWRCSLLVFEGGGGRGTGCSNSSSALKFSWIFAIIFFFRVGIPLILVFWEYFPAKLYHSIPSKPSLGVKLSISTQTCIRPITRVLDYGQKYLGKGLVSLRYVL